MNVQTKKLPRGQVELTIDLTVTEYEPFLRKAAETISQTTSIPGFRPGKANVEVIKQRVGDVKLWEEALEPAVRSTFVKALDQEKLITVGSPRIEVIKLAPGNDVSYRATIGVLPKVTVTDYNAIKIAKKSTAVEPAKVEQTLADLQKSQATETLVSRASKQDDKIEIDFSLFQDNVPIEQGKYDKFPLVIGEGSFIPGFEEQLVGLKQDETKEFELTFPANYHQKSLAGKLVECKVTMLAVYELTLPELTDTFATQLGPFKTIEEVKQRITTDLQNENDRQESERLETEILDALIEKSTFEDIPDLLISSEAQKMIEELQHNLSHQGVKFDDYLQHLKKSRDELMLDLTPEALKRVKAALLTRAIAEADNLLATDAEAAEEVKKTLAAYANDPAVRKQIETPAYTVYVKNILTARKTIEHLKAKMVQ